NRDERLSRGSALPPETRAREGLAMLYPREPSGGTWVGVNSAGMAFSLINWHSQPDCARGSPVSRGEVVRALLSARSVKRAASLLRQLPLKRMNPFRLMVASLSGHSLVEWRSDGDSLEPLALPWRRHHWFSSGLDEAKANQVRRAICARVPGDSLDLQVLRKLHRSHAPKAGAFSICMHRSDACTVSYTEIDVQGPVASMYYIAGSPCSQSPRFKGSIDLELASPFRKVA
ncbi:MAG: NRDE family protein, partial [Terrimicrobiaceae bacterium]